MCASLKFTALSFDVFQPFSLRLFLFFLCFSGFTGDSSTELFSFQNLSAAEIQVSPNGPVKTLSQAQEEWRKHMETHPGEAVQVLVRQGTYEIETPVRLTNQDRLSPLTISAAPNEKPIFCGSMEVKGFQPWKNGILKAELSEEQAEKMLSTRQLFENGKRLIRARHPNFVPENPYREGFFYVDRGTGSKTNLGVSVGNLHNGGTSLAYRAKLSKSGTYRVWFHYAAHTSPYGYSKLDERMTLTFNGKETVSMKNIPETGDWGTMRWALCAEIELEKGEHEILWKNVKGGGINVGGFALTQNPDWNPAEESAWDTLDSESVLVIPGDEFFEFKGNQITFSGSGTKDRFHFKPGEIKAEWVNPDLELKIFQSGSCRAFMEILSIAEVDEKQNLVLLEGPEIYGKLVKGDRYFLENHLDFLDSPGEWFFDRKNRTLYVKPTEENLEGAEYRADIQGTIFEISGADKQNVEQESANEQKSNDQTPNGQNGTAKPQPLTFSGLRFCETAHSRDEGCEGYRTGKNGVFMLKNARGVVIQDCKFRNIGRYAVCVNGGGENRVEGCTIYHSLQGGILVIRSEKNQILSNRIKFIGEEYKHIGGVILERDSSENLVAKNQISYSSRYGISLKDPGKKNIVEENRVENVNLETYDTGAIEVTQGSKTFQSESVIRKNYVSKTGGFSTFGRHELFNSWGIYLDSYAGGYLVEENYVEFTSHGGIMLQGGKGNVVRKNTFKDGEKFQGYFTNFQKNGENLVLEENTFIVTRPELKLFLAGSELGKAMKADKNIYVTADENFEQSSDFRHWRSLGFDQNAKIEKLQGK